MKDLEMSKFHDFEKQSVIKGQLGDPVIRTKDKGDQKAGSIMGYKCTDIDGVVSIIGASAQIDNILKDVAKGTYIRVTFVEKKKLAGGKTMNDYKIQAYDDEAEFIADHEGNGEGEN